MHEIDPQALKIALDSYQQARSLSKARLASELGLSRMALHRYTNGERAPDDHAMSKLASVLEAAGYKREVLPETIGSIRFTEIRTTCAGIARSHYKWQIAPAGAFIHECTREEWEAKKAAARHPHRLGDEIVPK